jgi:hypothetical protein
MTLDLVGSGEHQGRALLIQSTLHHRFDMLHEVHHRDLANLVGSLGFRTVFDAINQRTRSSRCASSVLRDTDFDDLVQGKLRSAKELCAVRAERENPKSAACRE